jgi:hypothetical protein
MRRRRLNIAGRTMWAERQIRAIAIKPRTDRRSKSPRRPKGSTAGWKKALAGGVHRRILALRSRTPGLQATQKAANELTMLTTSISSAHGGREALATAGKTPVEKWIAMHTAKLCADHLRVRFAAHTGGGLRSCHAHELTAAFFGYGTASALRAEQAYPLTALRDAQILIPDIALMKKRMQALKGLPDDLPQAWALAQELVACLQSHGRFSGQVWLDDDVETYFRDNYFQDNFPLITDELSGEMADTNAYFDELIVDEVTVTRHEDGLAVEATGELTGETHEDRTFMGDKINFSAHVTMDLAAGRTGFLRPDFRISGTVDESYYDD